MENFVNQCFTTPLHDPITQNQFSPVSVRSIISSAWGE